MSLDPATLNVPAEEDRGVRLVITTVDGIVMHDLAADAPLVIGREEGADLVVKDPTVSRRHATIRATDPPTLEDHGSTNGTFLGDRRLTPGASEVLALGEVARLGAVTVVLHRKRVSIPGAPSVRPQRAAAPEVQVVVQSSATRAIHDLIGVIAPSTIPVLILGETGVGKELLAEAVHNRSSRADQPLLRLSCSARARAWRRSST